MRRVERDAALAYQRQMAQERYAARVRERTRHEQWDRQASLADRLIVRCLRCGVRYTLRPGAAPHECPRRPA